MVSKTRYALLTVDTEALPKRASHDHVKRLIWGKHEKGSAGIREMCAVGDDVGVKHVFFTDMCGAYNYLEEVKEVVRWLDAQGQDVQLHTHPEYLPESFWPQHKLTFNPRYMNQFADAKAEFVIRHFGDLMSTITGKKIQAFRAGSFRWNAATLRALAKADIPLSFNNTMCARHLKQCPYSVPTNLPYQWSNGIIEVPTTERNIIPRVKQSAWWARLQYPESRFVRYRPWWRSFLPFTISKKNPLLVFLLHSWSLMTWDENGHAVYINDQRIEGYRKLLKQVVKDYDIITTTEFLELMQAGKIMPTHTENIANAEISRD